MKVKSKLYSIICDNSEVIRNIIGTFVVKGGALIVNFLTLPAYIDYFGDQTTLGVWYTMLGVLNWVLVFDLGIGNGLRNHLTKAIAKANEGLATQLITTAYVSMMAFAVAVGTIGAIIIPSLNWNGIFNVKSEVINRETLTLCVQIIYLGICVQFVAKIISYVLYALQRAAVVEFLSLCANITILIALHLLKSSSLNDNIIRASVLNVTAMLLPYIVAAVVVFGRRKSYRPAVSAFRPTLVKDVLGTGLTMLWMQIVFLIISSTNEYLITALTKPSYVIEYQAYYKVFNTGSAIFSLALAPLWSAATKKQAENDFTWIIKIYKVFLVGALVSVFIEMGIVPFLQPIMNVWLKKESIEVNYLYGMIFALSGGVFVLHNVNTSIGNGISYFRVQFKWMTFAAIVDIPLAFLLVKATGGWIGVIIANIIALLPYEIISPVKTMSRLNEMKKRALLRLEQHMTD